jgi:hypothetical protein
MCNFDMSCMYNYYQTPWSWELLEKLPVAKPLKYFLKLYVTRRFIIAVTKSIHWSLSWARSMAPHSISIKVKGKVFPVQAVEALRLARGWGSHIFRHSSHRWRQGCQPRPLFTPGKSLVLITVGGWVNPRTIVRLEGLGKLKKFTSSEARTGDLPACSIVPQLTTLRRAPHLYKIHLHIMHPPMFRSSNWSLSSWVSHQSSSPHSCYMSCPSHPPWLDHSNYTWQKVKVMKFLITQFSPTSLHVISLRFKYSPLHPVLTRPQFMLLH